MTGGPLVHTTPGPVLILGPEGAGLVAALVSAVERAGRRDGIRLSAALVELRAAAELVARGAMSAGGRADVPTLPGPADSEHDELTTGEAAHLLGVTSRHVRRLAADGQLGHTRRAGRALLVSKSETLALRTLRDQRNPEDAS